MGSWRKIFETERRGNTLIVLPKGDASSFRYMDVHIELNSVYHLLNDPELVNLIVDLSGIEIAGSVMLDAIAKMSRKVTNEGGQAVMCGATGSLLQSIETMNFDKIWPHFETRAAALTSLRRAAAASVPETPCNNGD